MEIEQIQNQLSVMKEQSKLPEVQRKELTSNSEISLFKLSNDIPLVPEDAPFIKNNLKSFLVIDKEGNNELIVEMFLSEIYEQGMGKKHFMRALKHAFKSKTYGNKDFLSHILSFDKTIKTYSYNQMLGRIKEGKIERSSDMIKVKFNNGLKSYIMKNDFIEGLMIIAEPSIPKEKNEKVYIDPKTNEQIKI